MQTTDEVLKAFGIGKVFKARGCTLLHALAAGAWPRFCKRCRRPPAARHGAQDSYSPINSLDFHLREDLLVTAGDDDAIKLYSVNTGEHKQTNYSRKYGAAHVCFTHHERAVIYASNKARRAACAGVPVVALCNGNSGLRSQAPGAERPHRSHS